MRHRLEVLAAALLFSTGGAGIKLTTLPGWQVAGFRSAVAAAVLLILLPESRDLSRGRTWLAAIAYAATVVLFALANKLTTSASAIFLQASAPLWLMLLAPVLLGERARPRDVIVGAAMVAGMALAFLDRTGGSALAPNPTLGNVLAATTGLTWALTVVALRSRSRDDRESPLPVVTAGNILAFAASIPFMGPLHAPAGRDVATLLYLGAIQVGLGYFFMARGVRHVPAVEASLLVLLEPAMNPVWAWLATGERPGALAAAGGLVILAATLVQALLRDRPRSAADTATPD